MKVVASAPGKVILVGEHFVVYGEPALVMAINLYVQTSVEARSDNIIHISSSLGPSGFFKGDEFRPEHGGDEARKTLMPIKIAAETTMNSLNERNGLNIEVTSTLPAAIGLGSSGALAVATVAAVSRLLGTNLKKKSIVDLSTEAERYVHINPSGVDQTISTYGGIISYKKDEGILRIKTKFSIPLVIGNTGVIRDTGRLVDSVRQKIERLSDVLVPLISVAGKLTVNSISALKRGDLEELGMLMDVNQGLLKAIGVSNEVLDRLIYAAKQGGALGAKLTGAGGGGCMVALSRLEERENVAQSISDAGGTTIIAEKEDRGVRSWSVK